MQLKIINKKDDPLLSRCRVESEISFEKSTPPEEEIKDELAKALGKDKKLIVLKHVYNEYGLKKANGMAYVYENEESLKRIERQKKAKKAKAGEENKGDEKPKGK
jgi:ribosomal protein S24E